LQIKADDNLPTPSFGLGSVVITESNKRRNESKSMKSNRSKPTWKDSKRLSRMKPKLNIPRFPGKTWHHSENVVQDFQDRDRIFVENDIISE
jgi:hypothetical protein